MRMKEEMHRVLRQLETGLSLAAAEAKGWEKAKLLLALRQVQKARKHLGGIL